MGLAVSTVERSFSDEDPWRSPPTVMLASAVLVATRVPKAELEAPTCGAFARVRLTERGTRVEMQCPTAGRFAVDIAKGELGPQPIPSTGCTAMADVIPGRYLAGGKISVTAQMLSDRFLLRSGAIPHLTSAVRTKRWS